MLKFILFAAIILVFIAYWFPLVTVYGNSMFPTYEDGQKLRARRLSRFEKLQIGAVYVFYSPCEKGKVLIKRLDTISGTDYSCSALCYFLGDNAENSFDSRAFGYVPRKNIIAKIL